MHGPLGTLRNTDISHFKMGLSENRVYGIPPIIAI